MYLPRFTHLRPDSYEELTSALDEHGPRAQLMAGGTDLLPRMKYRLEIPEVVVSVQGIPVQPPVMTPTGDLILDAFMTLTAISDSPLIQANASLIAVAAQTVASNEIRNMGTLGGNLCQQTRCLYYNQSHSVQFIEPCYKRGGDLCYFIPMAKKCWAVFMSDMAPVLISLKAAVTISGPHGKRQIPLEELYRGDPLDPVQLAPGELLREVIIPNRPAPRGSAFLKFNLRGGLEFAVLSVAVVLGVAADLKTCTEARITVGSVLPGPFRARKAEDALVGKELDGDLISEIARQAGDETAPLPHHGFSRAYLSECLKIHTHRALSLAAERVGN